MERQEGRPREASSQQRERDAGRMRSCVLSEQEFVKLFSKFETQLRIEAHVMMHTEFEEN